jgi:Fe-S-cluster containining protein
VTPADELLLNSSIELTKDRASKYASSLSQDLSYREDNIAKQVFIENSSLKSKLGKVYKLVDELGEAATPFTACKKGCSACCKMNASISSMEAEQIALYSSKKLNQLKQAIVHDIGHFSGVACPFLIDDTCSIYTARPYVCRANVTFDTTSYWCEPERAYDAELHKIEFSGAKFAYQAIHKKASNVIFADIRDFFS